MKATRQVDPKMSASALAQAKLMAAAAALIQKRVAHAA